jgi:hypothetical protein
MGMASEYKLWDRIPFRVLVWPFGLSAGLAAVGFYAPPLMTAAGVVAGCTAFALMIYGLLGLWVEPFREGIFQGFANFFLTPFYPIYYNITRPGRTTGSFVNLIVGFGALWMVVHVFPMYRDLDGPPPGAPAVAAKGAEPLDSIRPGPKAPSPAAAGQVTATTAALADLLAGVKDEATARKAAPRYRALLDQRRADFASIEGGKALDKSGRLVSLSALVNLGPEFREANKRYEAEWKRVRRSPQQVEALKGAR